MPENFKTDRGKFKWDILSNFSNIALDSHTAKHHKLEQFNLCEFRREWRGSAVNFFPVFLWGRREGSFAQLFFSHWKCLSSGVPPGFMGLKADPLHPEKISEPLYKSTGNTPFIMHQPCISNNAELHEWNAKFTVQLLHE